MADRVWAKLAIFANENAAVACALRISHVMDDTPYKYGVTSALLTGGRNAVILVIFNDTEPDIELVTYLSHVIEQAGGMEEEPTWELVIQMVQQYQLHQSINLN